MNGVTQSWRYGKSASSELASAESLSGRIGTWQRSLTYSRSTNASVAFPSTSGKTGIYYRTYFRYARYCHWYCDGVACAVDGQEVRPYSWERGTQVTRGVPVPSVKKRNCSHYVAGSSDDSEGSRAITWTNGVEVTGDLKGVVGGVSLSSRTGFTTHAENLVTFHTHGWLCGVFGPLSNRPGALVARRW